MLVWRISHSNLSDTIRLRTDSRFYKGALNPKGSLWLESISGSTRGGIRNTHDLQDSNACLVF